MSSSTGTDLSGELVWVFLLEEDGDILDHGLRGKASCLAEKLLIRNLLVEGLIWDILKVLKDGKLKN
jgi:hypothetical protein